MNDPGPQEMFDALFARLPGVAAWYRRAEGNVLDVLRVGRALAGPGRGASPRLASVMTGAVSSLLGAKAGAALAQSLARDAHVLAAHHHGVDCHPEFIQATLMAALPGLLDGTGGAPPILACSTVPLHSFSYPRGLLAAPSVRLPLQPGSYRHLFVHTAPPLRADTVRALARRWDLDRVPPRLQALLPRLLEEHILSPDVIDLPSFSQQITRINASLWQALHGPDAAPLIALDMESIVMPLLRDALSDEKSLVHALLFQPEIRSMLHARLQGVPGCWSPARTGTDGEGRGTAFFWFMEKGRHRRLRLEDGPEPRLVHAAGSLPLRPEILLDGLENGTLLPGLYLSYTLLFHDHGLFPHGGMYMQDYLPRMLNTTADLARILGFPTADGIPGGRPALATAFMPLRVRREEGRPGAGLLELLADRERVGKAWSWIAALPARRVFHFAAVDWYEECVPEDKRIPGWPSICRHLVEDAPGLDLAS
ncbi:MAG: hypothetical protein VB101_09805 [Rhodospirillaceae bacterium]|nr:hypothetical protein [Rhodospirillaceae bacterium]